MTWYLLGVITGIIIGVLIDRDTVYKTVQKFAKIKVKKSSNISDIIDASQKLDDISLSKKELRQRKRQTFLRKKRQIKRENRSKNVSNE